MRAATMRPSEAQYWDEVIQPHIDRAEQAALTLRRGLGTGSPIPPSGEFRRRPDAGWKWSRGNVVQSEFVGRAMAQAPEKWVLLAEGSAGLVPCAAVLLCASYPVPQLDGVVGSPCVFVWYLSTAPDAALELNFGTRRPKPLGLAALDIAIVRARALKRDLLLHAHPAGEKWLLDWYKKCGMTVVPGTYASVTVARPNDGRYLYFDQDGALGLSKTLDEFRAGVVT